MYQDEQQAVAYEKNMKEAFVKTDTNNDGQISAQELNSAIQNMLNNDKLTIQDWVIERVNNIMPMSVITFEDFSQIFNGYMGILESHTKDRKDFHALDKDGDGLINSDEFVSCIQKMQKEMQSDGMLEDGQPLLTVQQILEVFQKQVADQQFAKPGSKEGGKLSFWDFYLAQKEVEQIINSWGEDDNDDDEDD